MTKIESSCITVPDIIIFGIGKKAILSIIYSNSAYEYSKDCQNKQLL